MSFVREDLLRQNNLSSELLPRPLVVNLAAKTSLTLSHSSNLNFNLGPLSCRWSFPVVRGLSAPIILGVDFILKFKIIVNPSEGCIVLEGGHRLPFLPEPLYPVVATVEPKNDFQDSLKLDSGLSTQQRGFLLKLLLPEYFANDKLPFGRANGVAHVIDTGNWRPIHQGLRPTSPAEREIVRKEVEKMLAAGAIRPSKSPWCSPIVLVTKKDGSVRFCIDFRKLNDITVKDVHPLPRISDLLEALSGAKYFTTLDAASGYWQIPMDQRSIAKTAFICTEGLFEWLVMPFGLCNVPAVPPLILIPGGQICC